MIVYGTRSKELASAMAPEKCANCGSQASIEMHVFQKYFHVFWIPFIPVGKTAVSQCGNCNQVLKLKEMPDQLREEYEQLKSRTKTPVWMFSGLALLGVLITALVISDNKRRERIATMIQAPAAGDVYEVKLKDKVYTLLQVSRVAGDSVWMRPSQYETNKISGLREIREKGAAAYGEEEAGYAKADLQQMLGNKQIEDIDRK